MGQSESREQVLNKWYKKHLPSGDLEFNLDYSSEERMNLILTGFQKAVNKCAEYLPIPMIGSIVGFFLERYKLDIETKFNGLVDEKIRLAIVKESQFNTRTMLMGLKNNAIEFDLQMRNGNKERSQHFTAYLALLKDKEEHFKRENMMFCHLENFLTFATLYLKAHHIQITRYNDIYGFNDSSEKEHKENFESKVKEFAKFFEKHCNLFLYKKLSTLYYQTDHIRQSGEDETIFFYSLHYKNKNCHNSCYTEFTRDKYRFTEVIDKIIRFYHPKVSCLLSQFNLLIDSIGFRQQYEIELKNPDTFSILYKFKYIRGWSDILNPFKSGGKEILDLTEYGVELMVDYDQI